MWPVYLGIGLSFIIVFSFLIIRYNRYHPKKIKIYFKDFNKLPRLASHRGYGKKAIVPENTLDAFQKSTREGFRFHEMDVRISKDEIPVVFHGPDLSTTTNGFGLVESYTVKELQKLDWGDYLNKKKKSKKIPLLTLENYLSTLGKKTITNIELKKELLTFHHKLEKNTMDLVSKLKLENRIFFSSFNPFVLRQLKKRTRGIPIGLLVEPGFFFGIIEFLLRIIIRPDFIHPPVEMVTRKRIQKWKKKGLSVIVWTVNDFEKAKQLIKWGADLIITDNISMIKEYKKLFN